MIGHDGVSILEPNGKWVQISLSDGKVCLRADLEPESKLHSLHVIRDRERIFVATSRSSTAANVQPAPSGFHTPLIDGNLYALDRKTGEHLWQVPAAIDKFGLPIDQRARLPVLTFLRHRVPSSSRGPVGTQTSILMIDKRDGRLLHQEDNIPAYTTSYYVKGNVEKQTVTIQLPGKQFTIHYTDAPRPPAPPAQTGAASSLSAVAVDRAAENGLDLRGFDRVNKLKGLFGNIGNPAER